ncbi:HNH endonuclease [Mycobacteroides saopaulense]|uniref:HNH endonuclease n=1 Tax=Mycobacteroides saopaulense TaxID=1578165 RepID=A0A1S1JKS8_9MYCO|nr:HNH endonuclease signature motif containing protein [Mycobacteroides saopaulense]ALR11455.1 HNH endonuclease [Mycobacteroides saopaulense]OHT86639.1 HNH endonuclease [Mycobacteroides saopaulense]OHU08497.1 HNH endonuclease [Mycobacteroides saopaulense]ORB53599.1 HNH endonuclease [Mycobacteroides saopaulense]
MSETDPAARATQLVERIAELERVKAAAAAEQAHAAVLLDHARRAEEAANGVPRRRQGAGVATEIALARQDSPARGGRHLGFAKALVNEMPHTLAALECGALNEWRATILVRETAYLALEDRQKIDVEMCADPSRLRGLGDARLTAEAKRLAYRLDAEAVVHRARRAENERRVTIRPAPDTMTYLTALLPVKQGVAVYAALRRAADSSMDPVRGQGQIMADTLVERVTGLSSAEAVPVGVNITISDESLLGGGVEPAVIAGYGPIPAAVARRLVSEAVSSGAKVLARRLYRRCGTGALVGAESRSRLFPRGLAELIDVRDQTCRSPYCDAPIRHHDHVVASARGGATSFDNGQGLCQRCNYVKEAPGWRAAVEAGADRHTVEITTPTGTVYRSTAPPLR